MVASQVASQDYSSRFVNTINNSTTRTSPFRNTITKMFDIGQVITNLLPRQVVPASDGPRSRACSSIHNTVTSSTFGGVKKTTKGNKVSEAFRTGRVALAFGCLPLPLPALMNSHPVIHDHASTSAFAFVPGWVALFALSVSVYFCCRSLRHTKSEKAAPTNFSSLNELRRFSDFEEAIYCVPLKFDEYHEACHDEDTSLPPVLGHCGDDDVEGNNRAFEASDASFPNLERISSLDTSLSSSSDHEDEDGDGLSLRLRRSSTISFDSTVSVVPIRKFDEYPMTLRRKLWGTSQETHENIIRNSIEFAADGWDWHTVTLDEDMYVSKFNGELVHPVHVKQLEARNIGLLVPNNNPS